MNKLIFYLVIIQFFVIKNIAIAQTDFSNENILLHTDRDIYVAGEVLFFNCTSYHIPFQKLMEGSRYAYLILRNEGNAAIVEMCMKLEDHLFSGSIYLPDTLSTGRYQLVSFTNCMRNSGEKSFYKKEILIVNRFDRELNHIFLNLNSPDSAYQSDDKVFQARYSPIISLSSDRNVYNKRDKIRIAFDAIGLQTNEIAKFSVSVHEITKDDPNLISSISQENRGSSRFIGLDSAQYLKNYHIEASVISDSSENRELANKSKKLPGKKILPENNGSCTNLPEINGIILRGVVYNENNEQVVPNTRIFLSSPDTLANLQYTYTNNLGEFKFLLNDYYNDKNLILNLPDLTAGRIVLEDKYSMKEPFKPSRHFPDSVIKEFLLKCQNIVQIQKTYKCDYKRDLPVGKLKGLPPLVYPPVNDAVYPGDFVSLPDFVEISREILPLVKTRKHGNQYETRILDLGNSQFFEHDPLIFLDGVPINQISQIIGLGTDKINKIETVGAERYDGTSFYSGILAVFSKKMEINNMEWQTPTYTALKYVQFHPSSVFVKPFQSKSGKSPDFRQLLDWEPSVILHSNEKKFLEFSASDNKGEFEISVEGITTNGQMINTRATFKIVSNSK